MFSCFGVENGSRGGSRRGTLSGVPKRPFRGFGRGGVREGVPMERREVDESELTYLLSRRLFNGREGAEERGGGGGGGDGGGMGRAPVMVGSSTGGAASSSGVGRRRTGGVGSGSASSPSQRNPGQMMDMLSYPSLPPLSSSGSRTRARRYEGSAESSEESIDDGAETLITRLRAMELLGGEHIMGVTVIPSVSVVPHLSELQLTLLPDWTTTEKECSRTCNICLELYETGSHVRTLPCFHFYHSDCVDVWLRGRNSCPVCKRKVFAGTS